MPGRTLINNRRMAGGYTCLLQLLQPLRNVKEHTEKISPGGTPPPSASTVARYRMPVRTTAGPLARPASSNALKPSAAAAQELPSGTADAYCYTHVYWLQRPTLTHSPERPAAAAQDLLSDAADAYRYTLVYYLQRPTLTHSPERPVAQARLLKTAKPFAARARGVLPSGRAGADALTWPPARP